MMELERSYVCYRRSMVLRRLGGTMNDGRQPRLWSAIEEAWFFGCGALIFKDQVLY